jgi:glucose/arabinose dehydrogenase
MALSDRPAERHQQIGGVFTDRVRGTHAAFDPVICAKRGRSFCLLALAMVVIARKAPGWKNCVMKVTRRALATFVALGLLTAACSGGAARSAAPSATGPGGPLATAGSGSASSAAAFRAARVRLVQVASLRQPVAMAVRPGERILYVAEQTGRVRAIRNGRLDPDPVLDVSSQVMAGGEQGLLGLAFSPDGRFLYVDFTDRDGDTHVTEFTMRGRRADPTSGRLVLRVDQPFANHNGGQLGFGPDRLLRSGSNRSSCPVARARSQVCMNTSAV